MFTKCKLDIKGKSLEIRSIFSCDHVKGYETISLSSPGVKQNRKFENAMTIDKYSWGFRRNARLEDYLTMDELIHTFIITVR